MFTVFFCRFPPFTCTYTSIREELNPSTVGSITIWPLKALTDGRKAFFL